VDVVAKKKDPLYANRQRLMAETSWFHFVNTPLNLILLTNSMELTPISEANSCSATQEMLSTLWNLKAHYLVLKPATGTCPKPDEFSTKSLYTI
jgi:hypothetical protein